MQEYIHNIMSTQKQMITSTATGRGRIFIYSSLTSGSSWKIILNCRLMIIIIAFLLLLYEGITRSAPVFQWVPVGLAE